ncbi:MAG: hypothetical protein PUC29_07250 [Clostridia bacterium]|nr:hypothetical protein [Clostridia bacterium]
MADVFPSLIGNEKLKALMTEDILGHTVSHAYIVEGPEKSGRHTFAMSMINGLVCTAKSGDIPCGKCENCKKIKNGFFADIYYLNKGENATISVESVRQMLKTVYYSPNENSDYKFYIIEEAEKMTPAAQNALLLTLEEPPSYAVFLLLTTDSALLLETVRSRAVTLRMELFSPDIIFKNLQNSPEFKAVDEKTLKSAATLASGSLGAAAEIVRNGDKSSKVYENASAFVKKLCTGRKGESIVFVNSLKLTRGECDLFFRLIQSAVRDLIAYKNGGKAFTFYSDVSEASEICKSVTVAKLVRLFDSIVKASEDISLSNANITLVLTHLAASAA